MLLTTENHENTQTENHVNNAENHVNSAENQKKAENHEKVVAEI